MFREGLDVVRMKNGLRPGMPRVRAAVLAGKAVARIDVRPPASVLGRRPNESVLGRGTAPPLRISRPLEAWLFVGLLWLSKNSSRERLPAHTFGILALSFLVPSRDTWATRNPTINKDEIYRGLGDSALYRNMRHREARTVKGLYGAFHLLGHPRLFQLFPARRYWKVFLRMF